MRAENESETPGCNTTEDFHSWDYLEMMLFEDFAGDARDVCDVKGCNYQVGMSDNTLHALQHASNTYLSPASSPTIPFQCNNSYLHTDDWRLEIVTSRGA